MKTTFYIFGIIALLATAACSTKKDATTTATVTTTAGNVVKIVHGTSFGFCHGYCQKSVTYTPGSIVYEQHGRDSVAFPPGSTQLSFTKAEFDALVSKFKWQEWDTLSNNIGCPDCTDRGAEYIEITTTKGTKKVRFDAGEDPETFAGVLPQLRSTKNKLDKKMNAPEE